MSSGIPKLGLVIPCYNEAPIIASLAKVLREKLDTLIEAGLIHQASKIYLVDDGSEDGTWHEISNQVQQDTAFAGIKLTRTFGHQYALYAGLMMAEGDALISLDADFQDDINAIDAMIEEYHKGSHIVYGVRKSRETDTPFKRWSAKAHYYLSELLGINTVRDHADYRLLSRKAIGLLGQFKESNIYLRGVIPLLGLPASKVYYVRGERAAGKSKYRLRDMFSLSIAGITSFSIVPLRIIALMGLLVFSLSVIMAGWALSAGLAGDKTVAGWASTVIPIYFFGGVQLLALGIVGEYIGKAYIEVKRRPLYLVESVIQHQASDEASTDA
jgi:glycosyltransferase involved in cell wall biosynthesis